MSEPVLWFYGSPVLDVGEHYILFACGCCWWGWLFGEHSLCEQHAREVRLLRRDWPRTVAR